MPSSTGTLDSSEAPPRAARSDAGWRLNGWGALALMALLPFVVLWLWWCITVRGGALDFPITPERLRGFAAAIPLPSWPALAFYLGWFGFQALLQVLVPGKVVSGAPLADGSRLPYRLNGWRSFWITLGVAAALVGWDPRLATSLVRMAGPLMTTAMLFALAYGGFLSWHGSRVRGADRVGEGPLVRFFLGRELNPRTAGFDHKLFCEARPGLLLWVLLDLSYAAAQLERHGQIGLPMLLVCAFQLWYVGDYFYHEEAILSTWDIKHERFGFMLAFGDLVWVPFTYSIQALYLLDRQTTLPPWGLALIVLLNAAGYAIFRGSNLQKHGFRIDPGRLIWGKPAAHIKTSQGSLLLTAGYWRLSRHMNYLGDLMMGLAWCLACGFAHPVPYFYFVYFTILLLHRERRDHAACQKKYGQDWERYCAQVPYRILPGVY